MTRPSQTRRRFASLLVAGSAVAIGLPLTACAPGTPTAQPAKPDAAKPAAAPTTAPAPAAKTAPAAAKAAPKTLEAGTLKIAVMEGNMPYIALDPSSKKLIGYEGELIDQMSQKLGLRADPMLMEWAGVIQSVQSGRADVAVSGIHVTPQRAEQFLLSEPIAYYLMDITQKKSTNYRSLADLQGKTFGTIQGYTGIEEFRKVPNLELKLYSEPNAALLDLNAGRVDALYLDAANAFAYLKERPEWDLKVEIMVPSEWITADKLKGEMAFVLNKNNPELHQALNAQILEARKSGQIKELMAKYGLTAPEFQIQ